MKKFVFLILSVFLMPDAFSQEVTEKKGYFNTTQISVLMGNRQISENYQNFNYARSELFPSVTMTNGYMFNEYVAIGIGVGFEIFDQNLFPVFIDIRRTFWDKDISPFLAFKMGHSFSNFKKKYYNYLSLYHEPYNISNAYYRKDGGLMVHPEMGVKITLSENADLLFTVAYRYQKTKSTVSQDFGQHRKWEHMESMNRLSFGIAITFR